MLFQKSGAFSYLVFCESDKNKDMINNYTNIVKQLEDGIFSWVDEFEDEILFLVVIL